MMLKSRLCDYCDTCILFKGPATDPNTKTASAVINNANKKVAFKDYVSFTDCISEINNAQVDNAKGIDATIPLYNLIEIGDNYSKTPGSLWEYYRDEPGLNGSDGIIDFPDDNSSVSFKFKQKKLNRK